MKILLLGWSSSGFLLSLNKPLEVFFFLNINLKNKIKLKKKRKKLSPRNLTDMFIATLSYYRQKPRNNKIERGMEKKKKETLCTSAISTQVFCKPKIVLKT